MSAIDSRWRCDITKNIVGTDTEIIGSPCQCQACRMAATIARLEAERDSLLEAIKHGDDQHRAWLAEAIRAHFAGEPVPAPVGLGTTEALRNENARLEAELAKARETERTRIADMLDEEADMLNCQEDANVTRSNANLVRADFDYELAEKIADATPPASEEA